MRFFLLLAFVFPFLSNIHAQSTDAKYVMGIVLLTKSEDLSESNLKKVLSAYDPTGFKEKDNSISFEMRQASIHISRKSEPLAKSEWEPAALISWIWKNAENDMENHQAQWVISVSGQGHIMIDLYKTLTLVAGGLLEHSQNSIGVYMPNQYLLLPKSYYLAGVSGLVENALPITLWVYFGMWQENNLNSSYTWGLSAFGKNELEIVNSQNSLVEVQALIQESARQILENNLSLGNGDQLGDERKVSVTVSKGKLIEGLTTKIDY